MRFLALAFLPALLSEPLAAQAHGFIAVDFAPAAKVSTAHPPLTAPLKAPAQDPLFDRRTSDGLKQSLSRQIRMPPLSMAQRARVEIAWLGGQLSEHPGDPALLARRCFMRALAKTELEAALDDCDRAIAQNPSTAAWRDWRALVLYVSGDYPAALAAYDQALAADPRLASALLMRGQAKGKLGDAPGRDRDVAAATARDANILARYRALGILPR